MSKNKLEIEQISQNWINSRPGCCTLMACEKAKQILSGRIKQQSKPQKISNIFHTHYSAINQILLGKPRDKKMFKANKKEMQ